MKLKFIGTDGSMGLKHGEIYDVRVTSDNKFIWVKQYRGLKVSGKCPYSSPSTFAANWAKPGKKVKVRKKREKAPVVDDGLPAFVDIVTAPYAEELTRRRCLRCPRI